MASANFFESTPMARIPDTQLQRLKKEVAVQRLMVTPYKPCADALAASWA